MTVGSSQSWIQYAQWVIAFREARPATAAAVADMEQQLISCDVAALCTPEALPRATAFLAAALETQLRKHALPRFLEMLGQHVAAASRLALEGAPPDAALPAVDGGGGARAGDRNTAAAAAARMEDTLRDALAELAGAVQWHGRVLAAVAAVARVSAAGLAPAPLVASLAGMQAQYIQTLQALLLHAEPFNLCSLLERYYAFKLRQYKECAGISLDSLLAQSLNGSLPLSPSSSLHLAGDAVAAARRPPPSWAAKLVEITRHLEAIGLDAPAHEAISAVIHEDLSATLAAVGRDHFTTHVLQPAQEYVRSVPLQLIALLLPDAGKGRTGEQALKEWSQRLLFFVFDSVGRLYSQHMFNITVDYPDSQPAVEDMCTCLAYTNLHARFVEALRSSVKTRLLHAGVATDSILEAYIAAMKVLRSIDSSGHLMEAIAEPIKAYLRCRPDTIRCVVKMLTQDTGDSSGESLLSDMRNGNASSGVDYDDLEGVENVIAEAESWQPILVELDNQSLASHTSFDIIATLVDIYGDTDFVNEYKRMLANKLLKKADYHTGFETRTLELLKLRFAESELHHCDVMLKDMQVSRRLNLMLTEAGGMQNSPEANHLATLQHRLKGVSVLVCSHLFWPRIQSYDITLPAGLLDSLQAHAEMFHMLKSPRKLKFQASLGAVELDITVGTAVLRFVVPPVLAVIVLQFADAEELPAAHLAKACNLPLDVLLRKALFWVQHGALSEARLPTGELMYRRNEALPDTVTVTDAPIHADPDDEDSAPARPANRKATHDMEPYVQVINNILLSGHAVTLERMQKLLTLFCAHLQPKYNKTVDQLLAFLDVLVERGHLKCEGSMYSFAAAP